jgi:hypothetical protein
MVTLDLLLNYAHIAIHGGRQRNSIGVASVAVRLATYLQCSTTHPTISYRIGNLTPKKKKKGFK